MSEAWKSFAGAPIKGITVCDLHHVPDGNTHCLELDGYPIVLFRTGHDVRAYVNACPHQYLPLNHKGNRLISADRTTLRCTNHSAGYSAQSGEGTEGLGIGKCLDPIPLHIHGTTIKIGPAP